MERAAHSLLASHVSCRPEPLVSSAIHGEFLVSPLVEMSSWVIMELEVRIPQARPALSPYHKFFTAKSPYRFLALKTGASALSLALFRYRI